MWDLRALDLIDMRTEEVAYLCCDFSAKVRLELDRMPVALLLHGARLTRSLQPAYDVCVPCDACHGSCAGLKSAATNCRNTLSCDLSSSSVSLSCPTLLVLVSQVMFSAGLMLSSFKGLDSRREVVMRQIQEAHRQTLITELKRAIDQKDAFMSSVSHELRTPLNGIIGE